MTGGSPGQPTHCSLFWHGLLRCVPLSHPSLLQGSGCCCRARKRTRHLSVKQQKRSSASCDDYHPKCEAYTPYCLYLLLCTQPVRVQDLSRCRGVRGTWSNMIWKGGRGSCGCRVGRVPCGFLEAPGRPDAKSSNRPKRLTSDHDPGRLRSKELSPSTAVLRRFDASCPRLLSRTRHHWKAP